MNPGIAWPEDCRDGCGNFFGAYLKQADIDVPADGRVLEIGCAEFDWLSVAADAFPRMRFCGIDWRESLRTDDRISTIQGDARQVSHYAPNSFDWIVSISAMEHMGLGHYAGDPKDPDGDTQVMTNAFTWLKPGGWLLFDVPYQPDAYRVVGTSHREYNHDELFMRLWCEPLARSKSKARWAGTWFSSSREPNVLIERPTERGGDFYYVGVAWQKI